MTRFSEAARIRFGLILLLLLMLAGRFRPGVWTWGFSHLAYLPGWWTPVWAAAAVILLVPRLQRWIAGVLDPLGEALGRSWAVLLLPLLAGVVFWLLGRSDYFLGDGTWLSSQVDLGRPFHFFDFMDYRLHFLAKQIPGGKVTGLEIYRVGSVVAGVLAVGSYLVLARRLRWEPWRRAAGFALLFLSPPALLYFGYVESYGFQFAALTAFVLTGLLVLEGSAPLWLASLFFGIGLFLHLGGVFSAPALIYLAVAAPALSAPRRWLQVLGPPVLCLGVAAALYAAGGYDGQWFRKEFLDSSQARSIWLPLGGGRGLLSLYHWKDLFNQVLLAAPVPLIVLLAVGPRLLRWFRRPEVGFLAVQILGVALVRVFAEAKLGGAKDWDLLAAHSAGLPLLAAILLPPWRAGDADSVRPVGSGDADSARPAGAVVAASVRSRGAGASAALVIGASFLLFVPWVSLQSYEDRSLRRLIEVTADGPVDTQVYNLEDLARHYREKGQYDRAVLLFEECVARSPDYPRFRMQLAAVYGLRGDLDLAERQYLEVTRLDPELAKPVEMLGRIATRQGDYSGAVGYFTRLVRLEPDDAPSWVLLGSAAAEKENWSEAARAYRRAAELKDDPAIQRELGAVSLRLESYDAAAAAFRAALDGGDTSAGVRIGLAWARIEAMEKADREGSEPGANSLDEAETQLRIVLSSDSSDAAARQLLQRVGELRRGNSP